MTRRPNTHLYPPPSRMAAEQVTCEQCGEELRDASGLCETCRLALADRVLFVEALCAMLDGPAPNRTEDC